MLLQYVTMSGKRYRTIVSSHSGRMAMLSKKRTDLSDLHYRRKYMQKKKSPNGDSMLAVFRSVDYKAQSTPEGVASKYEYDDILFGADANLAKAVAPYIDVWTEFKVTNFEIMWWVNDDDQIVSPDQTVSRIQTVYDSDCKGKQMKDYSVQCQPNVQEEFLKPFHFVRRSYVPEFMLMEISSLPAQVANVLHINEWRDTSLLDTTAGNFKSNNAIQTVLYGSATNQTYYRYCISVMFRRRKVNKIYD